MVAETLPSNGTVHLSYGEEKMDEYVHQLAADHLIHGWDLAVATGGDPRLDPALVHEVAAWFADREDLYRQAGIVGPRARVARRPAGRPARGVRPRPRVGRQPRRAGALLGGLRLAATWTRSWR